MYTFISLADKTLYLTAIKCLVVRLLFHNTLVLAIKPQKRKLGDVVTLARVSNFLE